MIKRGIRAEDKVGTAYSGGTAQPPMAGQTSLAEQPPEVAKVVESAIGAASEPLASEPAPLTAPESAVQLEPSGAAIEAVTTEVGTVGMGPFNVTVNGADGFTVTRKAESAAKTRASQVLVRVPDASGKLLTAVIAYGDDNIEPTVVLSQPLAEPAAPPATGEITAAEVQRELEREGEEGAQP